MIKLIKSSRSPGEKWVINVDNKFYSFGHKESIRNELFKLGIDLEEIERAFDIITRNCHDYGSFGLNGTFIFSDKFANTAYRA